MQVYLKYFGALAAVFNVMLGSAIAQENAVTAIDIALEPDATMIQHAEAANARLREAYPKGYALDATHRPHITMLQRFVKNADLDKVYAAVGDVLAKENPAGWTLTAFRYDFVVWDKAGLTVILIKPTDELIKFQKTLIDAVAPLLPRQGPQLHSSPPRKIQTSTSRRSTT